MIVIVATNDFDDRAGVRIEEDLAGVALLIPIEIEHALQRTGNRVERGARLDALAGEPVILDEPDDRALVNQGVVDMVDLRKGRDHQQRDAGAVAATTLRRQAEGPVQRRRLHRNPLLQADMTVAWTIQRVRRRE